MNNNICEIPLDERILRDGQTGATSIFVILMMVVLFVFGLAALTTSLASLKLSQKNALWSDEYYAVEGQAETTLAGIDNQLYQAEMAAQTYFNNQTFRAEPGFDEASAVSSEAACTYISQRMKMIYYFEAYRLLNQHAQDKEMTVQSQGIDESLTTDNLTQVKLWVSYTAKEAKEAYPKNITVVVNIPACAYDVKIAGGDFAAQRSGDSRWERYQILQWQEWQNAFVYDNAIDFEDPVFEDPDFEQALPDESVNTQENVPSDENDEDSQQEDGELFTPVEE